MVDPSISPNDEGLDGIDRHSIPQASAPPVTNQDTEDPGIVAWRRQLEGNVNLQPGVEIIGAGHGSFSFSFRGQQFTVSIVRTA